MSSTSQTSPILTLPYLMPSQAQKHVTHNEALQMLDALVQLRVETFDAALPPATPALGEAHALGDTPTAAWAGHAHEIAVWQGEGWLYLAPLTGWRAWSMAESELRVWDGSSWRLPPAETQNLARLGVGTAADAANPLSVTAPATLFSHAGGSHQLKLNKADAADTASLLFQTNWSGRAEIGLTGNDDISIKRSADGSSWNEALRIDSNGCTGLGAASPAARLHVAGDTGITGSVGIGTNSPGYLLDAKGTTQIIEDGNQAALRVANTNPGFSKDLNFWFPSRAAAADWNFLIARSGGGSGDAEFKLSGDGNGSCDGSWTGGGADYAEWFEWADGKRCRHPMPVQLDGVKFQGSSSSILLAG